jgi:hypothetical protein
VTRKTKNLWVFVGYLISFSLVATAQDTSFSTESLMAAFSKGSPSSLKGSEVTVTGVVAEIKKSRVVFKSVGNDKVICELVSSIAIEGHPIGSSLTVVGRVRGRGMLGNVTLDQCNLASSNLASTEPATIESLPEPPEEPVTKVEEPAPAIVADAPSASPALPAPPAQPPKTLPVVAPNKVVADNELVESNSAVTTSEQPHKVVQENSNSFNFFSAGVFRATIAVLLGIGALLALVKFGPAIRAGLRPPSFPTTDKARRAALEALLAKDKKQK